MPRRFFLLLFLLPLAALPLQLQAASPVKARSLSGSGLLFIGSDSGRQSPRLVLYREPGIGRLAELAAERLPQPNPQVQTADDLQAVIVTAKKLGWYRIVYDDGEREGWLQAQPRYRFLRWDELLPGKGVVFLPGLRKEFYLLRSEPDPAARQLETVDRESGLTVLKVDGDWIKVRSKAAVSGWLRWRDDNGRLLMAIDCRSGA